MVSSGIMQHIVASSSRSDMEPTRPRSGGSIREVTNQHHEGPTLFIRHDVKSCPFPDCRDYPNGYNTTAHIGMLSPDPGMLHLLHDIIDKVYIKDDQTALMRQEQVLHM